MTNRTLRFGHGRYQEAAKVAHRAHESLIDWLRFQYIVFDAPLHKGPYSERHSYLRTYFSISPLPLLTRVPFCIAGEVLTHSPTASVLAAPIRVCGGVKDMESYYQDIVDKGGEGIILRDPTAHYQPGRSLAYLKHKVPLHFLRCLFLANKVYA